MCRFIVVQTRLASLTAQSSRSTDVFQSTLFRLSELFQPWTRLAQTNIRSLVTNNGCQYRSVRQLACPSEVMRIACQRPLWVRPTSGSWQSFARQYASSASGDANQSNERETQTLAATSSEEPLPKVLSVSQDKHLKVTTRRHGRIFGRT